MTPLYFYIHDFRSSGVVRDTLTYARLLSDRYATTIVAGHGNGLFREEAERGYYRLAILAERPGRFARLAAVPMLRRWLRRQPPGVFLSMGVHGHPTAYLACRGLRGMRRIYRISNEVAGPVKGTSRWRRFWLERLDRDAALLMLVGSAMARHDIFAAGIAAGRVVTVPSGVDIATAKQAAIGPIPHPWLNEDVPVVVGIGRLRPQKNLELLIEAVRVARRSRRIRLIILGGGPAAEQARMKALAADYAEDFLLAGETGNVFAWLARAGVFALPSRWEGSSLALLEAMAVGTPVVASCLAGDAPDVLAQGRFGLLVDGAGADSLAQAMLTQLSENCIRPRDRALDYDVRSVADLYARYIERAAI